MKFSELSDRIARGDSDLCRRQATLLTDDQNRLAGLITRGDIVRALGLKRKAEMTVAEAGCTQLVVAFPDEPLYAALAKMLDRNIGRLPVVERENQLCVVVGYLGARSHSFGADRNFTRRKISGNRTWSNGAN